MLVDNEGNRIDAGPVEIVFDATNTSGSPLIVNGISCMNCHKYGTIDLADDIREGNALRFNNEARNKVLELYPPRSEMDSIIEDVRREYLRKLTDAIGPFLLVGADETKRVTDFPEPVSHVARLYDKNLGLEEAACEIGKDSAAMAVLLQGKRLQQLGLGPLAEEGTVKRSYWESVESGISIFQEAASEIGVGSPVQ